MKPTLIIAVLFALFAFNSCTKKYVTNNYYGVNPDSTRPPGGGGSGGGSGTGTPLTLEHIMVGDITMYTGDTNGRSNVPIEQRPTKYTPMPQPNNPITVMWQTSQPVIMNIQVHIRDFQTNTNNRTFSGKTESGVKAGSLALAGVGKGLYIITVTIIMIDPKNPQNTSPTYQWTYPLCIT